MANFNTTGTAMDFLTSIAENIKAEVEEFYEMKKEDGSYEAFKELSPFAQRIEFFNESTNYKTYRKGLRQWILYGQVAYREADYYLPGYMENLNLIEENAAKRAGEVYDLSFETAPLFRTEGWEYCYVKTIMKIHQSLLEENPILSDPNIYIEERRHLMNLALRNNKQYQACQKELNRMVNKAVSSLISAYLLGDEERVYELNYSRVVEGL